MATSNRFGPRDATMSIVSAVLGTLIWALLPILTGRAEAWDAPAYWPTVIVTSFLLGIVAPVRAWRWGMALVAGQLGAALAQSLEGAGNLFPLGLALLVVLGALCAFLSWLGGAVRLAIGRSRSARAENLRA
jgi:hypothetical protein